MKIKTIKKLEKREITADIEVANTHTYQMANGMVSHNTVSQLVDAASGLHPRYAPYYIRRVRVAKTDPIAQFLINKGVPCNPDTGTTMDTAVTLVFDFPLKAPKNAVCRMDKSALQQLDHWKIVQEHWAEHKPSITVYVKEDEWLDVAAWVFRNWKWMSGVSFLPFSDSEHVYALAPYEEISEDEYKNLTKDFPVDINFQDLAEFESEDYTTGSQELACVSGVCEI